MSEPAWIPLGSSVPVSIGTSFPVSPVDGQEHILVDSLTAPTYTWRFRYVSTISDVYKWIFIGGAYVGAGISTNEAVAQGGWRDLATVGPRVIVPRPGHYHATALCNIYSPTALNAFWLGIAVNATNPAIQIPATINDANAGYHVSAFTTITPLLCTTLGDDIRVRYQAQTFAAQAQFRNLWVIPVRVS